jgi:glutathione S-transferase
MRIKAPPAAPFQIECSRDELVILSNAITNLPQSVNEIDHTTLIGATTNEIASVHQVLLKALRSDAGADPIKSLTLSHYPATRSARVLWALYEVADCDIVVDPVDLYAGAQYQPEFLAQNPNHNVPVLEITWADGSVQTVLESAAMVVFLGDAFPQAGHAPLPGASRARADYLQMIHFAGSPMDMMLWQIRIHEHVLPKDQKDARTIARYREKMAVEVEPQIAARLEKHDYICGDGFTLADCMMGHNVFWARGYGMCQSDIFKAYLSRLARRPAFAKAFSDAKSFTPQPPKRDDGALSQFNG